jgi:hypothetical protein
MSPALIDLEPFRHEIEMRVAGGDTHAHIRQWLATKGVRISKNAFSRRCVSWEASRRTRLSNEDPDLMSAIDAAFHTTNHTDETIAANITAQGIPTTANQVQVVRLANGWRRRANDDDQLAQSRSETFAMVDQALKQGEVRCYGRGLLRTYLRVKFRHNAREDDVRDALHVVCSGTPRQGQR